MKTILNLTIILIIVSCDKYVKKTDYSILKNELDSLKNTPRIRFENALKLYHNNDFNNAKSELEYVINKFNYSEESKKAKKTLKTVNARIKEQEIAAEKERLQEEKNKNLKFLNLKPNSTVTSNDVRITFKNIKTETKWRFEYSSDYQEWRYKKSEKNNSYLSATTIFY